jgi:hypothetical protein
MANRFVVCLVGMNSQLFVVRNWPSSLTFFDLVGRKGLEKVCSRCRTLLLPCYIADDSMDAALPFSVLKG